MTDEQALAAFRRLAELEGIIPALESSHAVAWVLENGAGGGRARADLPVGPRRQGPRRGAGAAGVTVAAGQDTIAAAFAASGKRAALMPYLMGGFPDLATSRAIGEAYAESGADLVELGVPFSDPLADGPVIHAAGTEALAAGATVHGVLEVGQALAETVPVVLMCYANLVLARGVERFADDLAQRGISGLIVPDLPLEEARRGAGRLRRGGRRARRAGGADDAGGRGSPRSGAARAASSTRSRSRARPASARGSRATWPRSSPARSATSTCRSRSGSASARPRRRPRRPRPAPTA